VSGEADLVMMLSLFFASYLKRAEIKSDSFIFFSFLMCAGHFEAPALDEGLNEIITIPFYPHFACNSDEELYMQILL
jgi:hypothetical protein